MNRKEDKYMKTLTMPEVIVIETEALETAVAAVGSIEEYGCEWL